MYENSIVTAVTVHKKAMCVVMKSRPHSKGDCN